MLVMAMKIARGYDSASHNLPTEEITLTFKILFVSSTAPSSIMIVSAVTPDPISAQSNKINVQNKNRGIPNLKYNGNDSELRK